MTEILIKRLSKDVIFFPIIGLPTEDPHPKIVNDKFWTLLLLFNYLPS